jgi:5-methyltetrahydropteroyltriglutamate--homocysteine methyltransferase
METYDTGSLPFVGDWEHYLKGSRPADRLLGLLYPGKSEADRDYFDEKAVEGFLLKVEAGIDVPNYPQFRDMNQMFLDTFTGLQKTSRGYLEIGRIQVKSGEAEIGEVGAIREHSREIAEKTGLPVRLKVCITGPYTLSSTVADRRAETFGNMAEAVSEIVEANLFDGKHGGVRILLIDEPAFGLVDEPLLDYGQAGRENLIHAWERVLDTVKLKGVRRGFHFHSTRDGLFWEVRQAEIIESHVDDPLYLQPQTRSRLEETDKFVKASIAVTDFDSLIRKSLGRTQSGVDEQALNEMLGSVWKEIGKGTVDPLVFIEDRSLMSCRLGRIVSQLGEERVPFTGPECGLASFPTMESAMELLRRVREAARTME